MCVCSNHKRSFQKSFPQSLNIGKTSYISSSVVSLSYFSFMLRIFIKKKKNVKFVVVLSSSVTFLRGKSFFLVSDL